MSDFTEYFFVHLVMIIIMYFISPVDRTSTGICCNASFKFPKFRILVLSLISNSKGAGPSPKVPEKTLGTVLRGPV